MKKPTLSLKKKMRMVKQKIILIYETKFLIFR